MKKKLFEYVHEVLSENEFLIVPNFGAFVVQKNTTFLGDGEYISIIFSAQQQNDDGVLKNYIVQNTGRSEEVVEEFITSSLEDIFETINNTGKFVVEGIGEFRAINDRIVFKADEEQYLKGKNPDETPVTPEPEPESEIISESIDKFFEEIKETEPTPAETSKIDIEEIRNTYSQRYNPIEENIPTNTPEPSIKEKSSVDLQKFKVPALVIIIVLLLGSTLYFFKDELATLNKPIQTNDSTQVVNNKSMEQLADTLGEISTVQDNEFENSTTIESPVTSEIVKSEVRTYKNKEPQQTTLYGNNTVTLYYVTKGSYTSKQEAILEKRNLDVTGFIGKVIETTSGKKYHAVIGEFSDLKAAQAELAFAKRIDNSFYLMTVKPNNK